MKERRFKWRDPNVPTHSTWTLVFNPQQVGRWYSEDGTLVGLSSKTLRSAEADPEMVEVTAADAGGGGRGQG